MMYCPYCHQKMEDNRRFCPGCGKEVSSGPESNITNRQELETLDLLIAYFSKMEKEYTEYDRVCEQVPYYGPGSSRAPFFWAMIIAAIVSFVMMGCCIAGEFGAAATVFGLSHIPCFFLVGGGLLVYRKNRINYRNCCTKYLELSQRLQDHYAAYPDCPISAQYTNPKTLQAIRSRLATGQSASISVATEQVISGFNRNRVNQLLSDLQKYTAHLPQPEIFFLPGKYFSANPGNFKDAAKYFLS